MQGPPTTAPDVPPAEVLAFAEQVPAAFADTFANAERSISATRRHAIIRIVLEDDADVGHLACLRHAWDDALFAAALDHLKAQPLTASVFCDASESLGLTGAVPRLLQELEQALSSPASRWAQAQSNGWRYWQRLLRSLPDDERRAIVARCQTSASDAWQSCIPTSCATRFSLLLLSLAAFGYVPPLVHTPLTQFHGQAPQFAPVLGSGSQLRPLHVQVGLPPTVRHCSSTAQTLEPQWHSPSD